MAYNDTSNFERSNGATNKMKGNNENIEKVLFENLQTKLA